MTFLKTFIFLVFLSPLNINYPHQSGLKEYKIDSFINVDAITDIEVTDSWTHKKWHLNNASLTKVQAVLKQSKVIKSLILKPGHLYVTILFKIKNKIQSESYYVHDSGIFFDPTNNEHPFSVEFKTPINWDKLR